MSERNLYNLSGLKRVSIAFAIMAMAIFAVQIERLLIGKAVFEFAYMGVLFLCWLLAITGTRGILKYRAEFAQAYRACLVAALCTLVGAAFAFLNWHRGGGMQSFIQFGVIFMMYTQMMAMMYSYAKILNGAGELCKRSRNPKKQSTCRFVWKPCVLIIILSLFAEQIAKLFSGNNVYVIAGSAAALALAAHFMMIRTMLSVNDMLDGRPTGQRPAPKTTQSSRQANKQSGRQGAKQSGKRTYSFYSE